MADSGKKKIIDTEELDVTSVLDPDLKGDDLSLTEKDIDFELEAALLEADHMKSKLPKENGVDRLISPKESSRSQASVKVSPLIDDVDFELEDVTEETGTEEGFESSGLDNEVDFELEDVAEEWESEAGTESVEALDDADFELEEVVEEPPDESPPVQEDLESSLTGPTATGDREFALGLETPRSPGSRSPEDTFTTAIDQLVGLDLQELENLEDGAGAFGLDDTSSPKLTGPIPPEIDLYSTPEVKPDDLAIDQAPDFDLEEEVMDVPAVSTGPVGQPDLPSSKKTLDRQAIKAEIDDFLGEVIVPEPKPLVGMVKPPLSAAGPTPEISPRAIPPASKIASTQPLEPATGMAAPPGYLDQARIEAVIERTVRETVSQLLEKMLPALIEEVISREIEKLRQELM